MKINKIIISKVWQIKKESFVYAIMGFVFAAVEMHITSIAYFSLVYRYFFVYGFMIIFFIFLVCLLVSRKNAVTKNSWHVMELLSVVCICGVIASLLNESSMVRSLVWALSLLLVPVFFIALGPDFPLSAVKGISLYCRIILLLYLVSVVLFRKNGMYLPEGSSGARFYYFLGHVNSSVKLALPALAVFAIEDIWNKGKIRISTWVFTFLTLIAQFYTASYVAAVGMCIYMLFLFVFPRKTKLADRLPKCSPIAASGFIFAVVVLAQKSSFLSIVKFANRMNRSRSIIDRGLIWDMGLSAIAENVLGYGPFCDYSHFIRIGSYLPSSAHNLYIDAAVQTGIIGAIIFIILLFLLINNMPSWKRWPVIPAILFSYAVMWNFEPYFVDLYLQCTLLILFLMFCLPAGSNDDLIRNEGRKIYVRFL